MKQREQQIAIQDENREITYEDLGKYSYYLENVLKNKLKKGDIVILYGKKTVNYVITMIALIMMEVTYIPLDELSSLERVQYIANDVDAKLIVTDNELYGERFCTFSELMKDYCECDHWKTIFEKVGDMEHIVYMICTSGTTGHSKKVMIQEKNLVNLLHGLESEIYDKHQCEDAPLKIAVVASFAFDASVKQIFYALCKGHELIICPTKVKRLGRHFIAFLQQYKIDVVDVTPTLLTSLCLDRKHGQYDNLKILLVGGEPFYVKQVEEARILFAKCVYIYNIYGPTECCVDVSCCLVTERILQNKSKSDILPVGRPFDNIQFSVEEGSHELVIMGECVAKGYWNDEHSEAFFNTEAGQRCYRTGDVCQVDEQGLYYVMGRNDSQVKVNGFRIDLSSIEREIMEIKNVEFCVVELIRFPQRTVIGAAVKMHGFSESGIVEKLLKVMPNFMLPKKILSLDKMVLNVNGKIDRAYYREEMKKQL